VVSRLSIALVLVTLATSVYADEVPQEAARAHYDAAQKLYDEGRYEEAIAEFEQAYRDKPHPNVLYNIGQAQERLLDYDKSVTAFERYLREAAPDDPRRKIVENRLRVLRNLPARVKITTVPDKVHATLHGPNGVLYEADAPHEFQVPAGTYELELTRDGWEPKRDRIETAIGQPYFYQYQLERSHADTIIESIPTGARVFIDDRLVGETPWHGPLDVGKHGLLLEYPEYPWHRELLRVQPGQPQHRIVKLEKPVRSGRTELVIGSMVLGGAIGPLLVGAISGTTHFTQSGAGIATLLLSSAAGIGAGFTGAFLTTRGGVPVGTSSILIGAGGFGTGMGAALALGLNTSDRNVYGITLAGSAVGLTAGVLAARFGHVSSGDAAMVNSGGIWGTAGAALLAQAIPWGSSDHTPSASQTGWMVLGGSAFGLAAGILSAKFLERTRTEVAIVDLSTLVGTGLGFALGYAVGVNNGSDSVTSGARFALGVLALGLVSGVFIARNWAKKTLLPQRPGHSSIQMEMPRLRMEQRGPTDANARIVAVDLLRGTW